MKTAVIPNNFHGSVATNLSTASNTVLMITSGFSCCIQCPLPKTTTVRTCGCTGTWSGLESLSSGSATRTVTSTCGGITANWGLHVNGTFCYIDGG
ncbi:hypothetical protein BS17DRAFT_77946 [Gyrodon lividus]|nr:hypothetical protein BS17DRAFT_77946 [Gyrodon lividus]